MATDNTETPKTVSSNLTKEVGRSGTLIYSGIITGEDYNRQLTGRSGYREYEIMRKSDSTIRQALLVVKLPIRATPWDIQAPMNIDGEVDPDDEEKAKKIKREIESLNVDKFIKDLLTMCDFGFSLFEKVYIAKYYGDELFVGIQKLAFRKQTSVYAWETLDHQPGITQIAGTSTASIPSDKLIRFTFDQEGDNYEGVSMLRSVYKDWDIKDKVVLVNAIAIEKHGVGVPKVTEKEGVEASSEDKRKAIDALQNMRANQSSYLEVPNTLDVEMLDLKASGNKDALPTIKYHDDRIMAGVMARFLELGGSSGSGSQSLSTDLSTIFLKSEQALATEIAAAINEQLIKQLCDLNFSEMPNGYPKFIFGAVSDDDPSALAESVSTMANAGLITPDADIEAHMRKITRLPSMSQETRESWDEKNLLIDNKSDDEPIIDKKTQKKIVDEGKETLKKTKDLKAAVRASRAARERLISELVQG